MKTVERKETGRQKERRKMKPVSKRQGEKKTVGRKEGKKT